MPDDIYPITHYEYLVMTAVTTCSMLTDAVAASLKMEDLHTSERYLGGIIDSARNCLIRAPNPETVYPPTGG